MIYKAICSSLQIPDEPNLFHEGNSRRMSGRCPSSADTSVFYTKQCLNSSASRARMRVTMTVPHRMMNGGLSLMTLRIRSLLSSSPPCLLSSFLFSMLVTVQSGSSPSGNSIPFSPQAPRACPSPRCAPCPSPVCTLHVSRCSGGVR